MIVQPSGGDILEYRRDGYVFKFKVFEERKRLLENEQEILLLRLEFVSMGKDTYDYQGPG